MKKTKPRVLILEDSPYMVKSQISEVKKSYATQSVVLPETAIKCMDKVKYDIIVIDLTLPTKILSNKDGNRAGYSFYNQYVKDRQPFAKIVFWDWKTDKYFDSEKYNDKSKFFYLHKTKERYALKRMLDKLTEKPKENSIVIDGVKIYME